jgi:hypothetical protein
METIMQNTIDATYIQRESKTSVVSKFMTWCKGQEKYRFGWLAAIVTSHGCVLTPITMFAIVLSGNSIILWAFALGAMAMSLVSNLAAMPTKITIPIFFFSIFIDVVIIASCVATGFDIGGTYI